MWGGVHDLCGFCLGDSVYLLFRRISFRYMGNEAVGTVGTHSRIIRSEELGNGREVGQQLCKNGI